MFFTRWLISKWSSMKHSDCIRQRFCKYTMNKTLVLYVYSIDLLFRKKIDSIIKTNPFPMGGGGRLPLAQPLTIAHFQTLIFNFHFKVRPCPFSDTTPKSIPIIKSELLLKVTRLKNPPDKSHPLGPSIPNIGCINRVSPPLENEMFPGVCV